MPITNYTVLAGRPTSGKVVTGSSTQLSGLVLPDGPNARGSGHFVTCIPLFGRIIGLGPPVGRWVRLM
jgi:hypothetical protein